MVSGNECLISLSSGSQGDDSWSSGMLIHKFSQVVHSSFDHDPEIILVIVLSYFLPSKMGKSLVLAFLFTIGLRLVIFVVLMVLIFMGILLGLMLALFLSCHMC
jgi:hypothetical protein